MKSAEEIFNEHSWKDLGAISPSGRFCIPAMKEYAEQVAEQALRAAAEKITLGQTVTSIQKSIRNTEIKLP